MDLLMQSNWAFWLAGGAILLGIFVVAWFRYSTARFRTDVAFKHNDAGLELMRKKRFTEAIREFEVAMELDPNVEAFKNNIEICKAKMMEEKSKKRGKMSALGFDHDE